MHRRSRSRSRSRAPEDHSLIEAFEPAPPMHSRQSLQQTRQRLLATRFNPPLNQQNTPMQRHNAPAAGVMRNSLGQSAPAHRSVQRPTDPRTHAWAPRPNLPVNRASDQAMANQRRPDDPVNARTQQIQANTPMIPTNRSNSSLNQPNVTPRQNGSSNIAQMLADRRSGAVTPNQRLATNSTSRIGGQPSQLGPVQQMKMRVNWSTQRPSGLATPVQPRPIGQANNNSSTSMMRQFPIRGGRGQQPQQQQMRRAAPSGNCNVPSPPQMPLADEEDNVLPHSLLPDYEYSNEDNNPENNNNSGGGGGATTPNAPQRRHAIHSDDSDDDDEDDEDEADDYRGGNSGTHAQPTAKRGRIETTYNFNTTTIANNSNNDNMNLFDGPSTSAAAAAAAADNEQQQMLAMMPSSSSSSNWVDTQNALANDIGTNFDDEIERKDELCNKFMSYFALAIDAIEQTLHQKKSK
ncbi:hypothetical protein niasHS_001720 [Heterodera schachtii]|uniref:Uncharacterized protein n=1 Tax=Heterodera schachtii TaxID=97005 RepID=A0ABD2KBV1_HETSC